jgi:hypothetical protein
MRSKGQSSAEYALVILLAAIAIFLVVLVVSLMPDSLRVILGNGILGVLGIWLICFVIKVITHWDWFVFKYFKRNKDGRDDHSDEL